MSRGHLIISFRTAATARPLNPREPVHRLTIATYHDPFRKQNTLPERASIPNHSEASLLGIVPAVHIFQYLVASSIFHIFSLLFCQYNASLIRNIKRRLPDKWLDALCCPPWTGMSIWTSDDDFLHLTDVSAKSLLLTVVIHDAISSPGPVQSYNNENLFPKAKGITICAGISPLSIGIPVQILTRMLRP